MIEPINKNTDEHIVGTFGNSSIDPIIITGTIKDSLGKPLEGVTVKVKKTTVKTTTDKNGHFSLKVDDKNAVLVFSYVGYETIERTIETSSMDVAMIQITKKLDDVIVIGYGTVQKSDLVGSVSKIKNDNNGEKPFTSVDQMIQGQAAGVQITQNTGAPGAGMTFLIRGVSTVSGSADPLYVVDGFPINTDPNSIYPKTGSDANSNTTPTNPLAFINPNDIESIEILKDAASIAIYGSRGANGVVMITTKKAKAREDRFNFISRVDEGKLPKQIAVLNTPTYLNFANQASLNSGLDSAYKQSTYNTYPNINWQDLIYQAAISTEQNLSLTGGDEKNRYTLSANYLNQQGIVRNSSFIRETFRFNLDHKVNDKLRITLIAYATPTTNKSAQQNSTNGDLQGSVISGALLFPPITTPDINNDINDPTLVQDNPLTIISQSINQTRANLLVGNIRVDYKLLEGLNFISSLGANNNASTRDFFLPVGTYGGSLSNGSAYEGTSNSFNYLFENTLNYKTTFNVKHRIVAVAGFTFQNWDAKTSGVTATNFVSQVLNFEDLGLAQNSTIPVNTHTIWALESMLARCNYIYDNRYTVDLSARADGSTKLAPGNKWAYFPAIGAGWNIQNEQFFPFKSFMDLAKLRASYGISGNQNVPVSSSVATVGSQRVVENGAIVNGLSQSSLGNPTLKWETTNQYNVGLDLSFFNGRISFTTDMYRKLTSNLLINLSLPQSSGFSSFYTNIGKIENKGIEFSVSALVLTQAVRWTVSGNLSFNRNNVVNLGGVQVFGPSYSINSTTLSLSTALASHPIGSFYGYKTNGVYQTQQEVANGPYDNTNPQPGDIRFKDVIGNDTIDSRQETIIGNPYPNYTFGITNIFVYKRFTLSFLITSAIGQDIFNMNRLRLDNLYYGAATNESQYAWDHRWQGPGTSNYYPAPSRIGTKAGYRQNAPRAYTQFSDFEIEKGSYIRLKNVSISYNLNTKKVVWIQSARLFASATNLFIITKYTGYDPEISASAGSALSPGIDNGTIPQQRVISMGINVVF